VSVGLGPLLTTASHIEAGTFRVLGISSAERKRGILGRMAVNSHTHHVARVLHWTRESSNYPTGTS
jgi:hypothetical protein